MAISNLAVPCDIIEKTEVRSFRPEMTRIAMWSGPRNVSTAMMRAWGNRADTVVCDEPLYGNYLRTTGKPHPSADEIIACQSDDWRKTIAHLTTGIPPEKPGANGISIFFQKHMAHHLLPTMDREWILGLKNCILIRNPNEVIPSYLAKNRIPSLEDLAFVQQLEIFNFLHRGGLREVPIIDAQDVQNNPRRILVNLCDLFGVPFSETMLSWEPGSRPTDGIWAKHWYKEVETSTSFRPHQLKNDLVPDSLQAVLKRCLECYEQLYERRMR
jgi:hypothetical protein